MRTPLPPLTLMDDAMTGFLSQYITCTYLQKMLVFPEVLSKDELEELNHMVQPIEKFFFEDRK